MMRPAATDHAPANDASATDTPARDARLGFIERALKWLLPFLILADVGLVQLGLVDLGTAFGIVVGFELIVLLLASRQIFRAVRQYRRDRSLGLDVWAAFEDGLTIILPRRIARVVSLEPKLWWCLVRWIARRPAGANEFRYHRRSPVGPMLLVVVFTLPVELLLVELLVPWDWLRLLLLILGIYGVIWAFAYYAALVTLAHRLEPSGVRVRHSAFADGQIPYSTIDRIELVVRKAPGGAEGLRVIAREDAAYFAIGGRTDLTLHLSAPCQLEQLFGPTAPVRIVNLAVNEPDLLARALEERVSSARRP